MANQQCQITEAQIAEVLGHKLTLVEERQGHIFRGTGVVDHAPSNEKRSTYVLIREIREQLGPEYSNIFPDHVNRIDYETDPIEIHVEGGTGGGYYQTDHELEQAKTKLREHGLID